MRKIRYLSLLMAMLLSVAVMGQNTGDFNPDSPSEPGEPVLPDPPAPTYMLTLVATEGGSIKSGGGRYEEGAEVTVVANAAATNYVFLGWTDEAGNTLSQNLSFTYTMPAKDVTLKANYTFNPNSPAEPSEPDVPEPPAPDVLYTLTLVATEGGSIKSGAGEYKEGTEVTVVANAAATNFVFTGWTDEGGNTVSQTLSYTFAMPARDVTLKANYLFTPDSPSEPSEPEPPTPAPITHVLTVIGGEGGSISVNGTKVNGSASFDIEEEATANISVSLATNYVFDGWYADGELYSAVKDFTFTMGTQDVTFEARFSYNPDSPSEPSQPEAGGNEVYLMSVVGLPGETINFPVYLNNTDVITDMKFEILFPAKMTPDFTKALYPQAQGYKLEYKRTDIVGELGARPMADASNEGIIEPGELAVYEVSLTGGVTPPGNTAILVIPVTIASDIEKKRHSICLGQVELTKEDGTTATTSIRNGAVNTDYEEPDSYSYLYNLISVGSTTCEVTQVAQEDNPVSDTFACDMAGIDQLLVCSEPSFVTFKGLSELGKVTDEFTADNGFWINHDGYVCSATDAARAFCVKFDEAASQLVITQAPNAFSGEDEVNTKVYFTYKYKYYEVAVKLKVLNKSYNVTYYVDDEVYSSQTLMKGTEIPAIDAPVKTGYTFKSWKGLPEDMIMPGHDLRVDAEFSVNSYKLTYKVDGEVYKQYDVEYNAAITPEPAPEKVGHTFSGWSQIPETMPANDVEVTGTFTINSYTITFDSNGGSEVAPITAEYGTPITKPADPVFEGHTFMGWDKEIPETMPAEDMTITAQWDTKEYTITYIVDGEEWYKERLKYGSPITPPTPEKEGYTFDGWDEVPETMPAYDIEIRGSFTINKYKVTFISEGDILKEETLDYGAVIIAPKNPEKTGHDFTGWDPTFEEGATVPAHDVTYTAQFKINQYTITFDTDGGSAVAPITQDYNTAVTPPADPTKTGYTFAGWDKAIPATMPAEDITIKALWTINSYKLTYKVDGDVYKQYDIEYNATITPEPNPEKEGYTFSGWSEIPETMPANDVDVTGAFTINQYKVTFISEGVIVKEETLDFGTTIVAPENPEKVGHKFECWSSDFADFFEGATVPAHDVTYTAQFSVRSYTFTFDSNGGSEVAPITAPYGSVVTKPEDPEYDGHIFKGWYPKIPDVMPAEDMHFIAEWSLKDFTEGGLNYSVISNTDPDYYVKVVGVEDKSVDIIDVPATVKCEGTEYRIISVGSEAFANIPVLLEVKFNSVVNIPADAFVGSGTEVNLFVYAPAGSTCEYKGNVVIDGKAENVVLKDAQPLRISREFKANKVSYSREFTKQTYPGDAGGWETIVLPFDVEKIESNSVEITPFSGNVDGKHFWLAYLRSTGFTQSSSIDANTPYIISMPNSDEYDPEYNISGTVTFSAENAKMKLTSNAETSEGNKYNLVPTYEGVEASSEIYVLNDEESYQHRPGSIFVSGGRSVRPFEAYVTDKDNGAKPLYFEIETATSGIRNIEMEGNVPTTTYDLSGRPASASQKGFVIIRKPNGEYRKIYNK